MRSMKKASDHSSLLQMLILHPATSLEVLTENGIDINKTPNELNLSVREQRKLTTQIKERVNGSNHS